MKIVHGLCYLILVSGLVFFFATTRRLTDENVRLRSRMRETDRIATQLFQGKSVLSLYATYETDLILAPFASRSDIREVSLEDTGVGKAGVTYIASMPNVASLTLQGETGIGDEELSRFSMCAKLESLLLRNTAVTDGGIMSLVSFPSLKNVALYGPGLTDDALNSLAQITWLENVVVGEWATLDALARLRFALPKCNVRYDDIATAAELTVAVERQNQSHDHGKFTLAAH